MIPIGHQTNCLFVLNCSTFIPKHVDLRRTKAGSADKINFLELINCLHCSIKLRNAGRWFQLIVLWSVKPC